MTVEPRTTEEGWITHLGGEEPISLRASLFVIAAASIAAWALIIWVGAEILKLAG